MDTAKSYTELFYLQTPLVDDIVSNITRLKNKYFVFCEVNDLLQPTVINCFTFYHLIESFTAHIRFSDIFRVMDRRFNVSFNVHVILFFYFLIFLLSA